MAPEQSNTIPIAEIDVTILKELLEAGNGLAEVVDAHRPNTTIREARALARWEEALFAVGRAVE